MHDVGTVWSMEAFLLLVLDNLCQILFSTHIPGKTLTTKPLGGTRSWLEVFTDGFLYIEKVRQLRVRIIEWLNVSIVGNLNLTVLARNWYFWIAYGYG